MPSKRVKRVDLRGQSLDGVELFAKYHIIGMRHSKNGYITQVKHVQFGWMKPDDYYRLQKLHDFMPLIEKFIEGGYRFKAAVASASVEVSVLGTGINIPFGAALIAAEAFNLYAELIRRPVDPQALLIRLYAALGPFGDIIQIIDTTLVVADLALKTPEAVKEFFGVPDIPRSIVSETDVNPATGQPWGPRPWWYLPFLPWPPVTT